MHHINNTEDRPGRRRTGLFLPLQQRTLPKTPRKWRSHRERGSLLGLARRLDAETRSLFDSRAWRFWRIRELAIAAIVSLSFNLSPLSFSVTHLFTLLYPFPPSRYGMQLLTRYRCKKNQIKSNKSQLPSVLTKCHCCFCLFVFLLLLILFVVVFLCV